uniref:Uncharacterized protein n=1 Tax=Lepeophtheirus salmonis TaxID=72036 RepID=A0A0K2VFW6_LEPSM
MELHFINHTL